MSANVKGMRRRVDVAPYAGPIDGGYRKGQVEGLPTFLPPPGDPYWVRRQASQEAIESFYDAQLVRMPKVHER